MDNQHQLNFATKQAQYNYFASLPKMEFEKFSYQRQDGVLRVEEHIDNLLEYNYVMYQNDNYSDKWFYCFITGMEYVNDNCTFISIKTDVFQTWFMDLSFKQCFVEREHVNNDTFGLHTLEENIPSGEWIVNGIQEIGFANPKSCYVLAMFSDMPDSMVSKFTNTRRVYNDIPNGCYMLAMENDNNYSSINEFVNYFDYYGKGEAIIAMYLIPKEIFGEYFVFSYNLDGYAIDGFIPNPTSGTKNIASSTISRNTTLDGYTPKNNKCFTKQFNYLLGTNNAGASTTYYYEDFTGTPSFSLNGIIAQGCPSRLTPTNYKRTDASGGNAYSISGGAMPVCSWKSDYYLNWQAKNGWTGVQQRGKALTEQIYTGNNEGNALEYFGNFVEKTALMVGQELSMISGAVSGSMANAERTPDPVKGDPASGDFNFSNGKTNFTFYKMSVRAEVAQIIDKYFSAYGYKVSTWKLPNFTGRRNWNFVKLNQVNVTADMPQNDLEEIKKILTNGVTIWHNPSTFLDYSQNNDII